jgi:hypothetical protein
VGEGLDDAGVALFRLVCLINHSCEPSVELVFTAQAPTAAAVTASS